MAAPKAMMDATRKIEVLKASIIKMQTELVGVPANIDKWAKLQTQFHADLKRKAALVKLIAEANVRIGELKKLN